MKIIITRSFSKKVQLRQFEPIDSFCSIQSEIDVPGLLDVRSAAHIVSEISQDLDTLARSEVEKTIGKIRGPKEQGKSASERKEDAKSSAEHDAGWREV